MTRLNVVICTYNRADILDGVLSSLVYQTMDKNRYEVIVVDNASCDNTKEIAESYSNRLCLSYAYEPRQGLSHARNLGFKKTNSSYVAYLDDDVRLKQDWVKKVLDTIDEYRPDIFGGPVFPCYQTKQPRWFLDKYATFSWWGGTLRPLRNGEYLSGNNIVFRKDLLEGLSGFNPALGMQGRHLGFHEEAEIIKKAKDLYPNIKIMYIPDMFIHHLVPIHKMSLLWHIKRSYYIAMSNMALNKRNISDGKPSFFALFRNAAYQIMVILFKGLIGICCRNRKKYKYYQNFFVEKIMYNMDSLFNNLWAISLKSA